MSTFKALNIEYDEESDEEVDDTKEIQIEEALKLYQIALKFHAEGPASFDEAAKAYQELFASEIFRYPESQIELQRIEVYGYGDFDDDTGESFGSNASVSAGLDAGPSSLPQILHLSHKNYAQFRLESLAARLDNLHASLTHVLSDAAEALQHFVAALDKDDSDLDLWKKTARVGYVLDSKRITRFCLEAVLDGDEEGLGSVLSLPGIEDGIAAQQLRALVTDLDDHLSLMQPSLLVKHRKVLSRYLNKRLDTFQNLISKVQARRNASDTAPNAIELRKHILRCPQTWTELGELLLSYHADEPSNHTLYDPAIVFELHEPQDHDMLLIEESAAVDKPAIDTVQDTSVLPESIETQSPSLDGAKRPPSQQSNNSPVDERRRSNTSDGDGNTVTLPSRKRQSDAAGIQDGEEGRFKSKRLRARESIVEQGESKQALHEANIQWEYDQHLKEIQDADTWLYETTGALLNKLGVSSIEGIRDIKSDGVQPGSSLAQRELSSFLSNYSDVAAQSLLSSEDDLVLFAGRTTSEADALSGSTQSARKSTKSYEPLVDEGLSRFLRYANDNPRTMDALAIDFTEMMLCPGKIGQAGDKTTSYTACSWPEQLKTVIVRVLVNFDAAIYDRVSTAFRTYCSRQPDETLGSDQEDASMLNGLRVYSQSVLELHLDVYSLIRRTNSGVDQETIVLQGNRLERWFELTREVNHVYATDSYLTEDPDLTARFLWSTTFYLATLEDASQDRILIYMQDLREQLSLQRTNIELVNNAIMPEVSVPALDREISKLTTKDFFERISDMERSDPVSLIEMIEPLLDALNPQAQDQEDPTFMDVDVVSPELITFLKQQSSSEVLRLWTRLLDAYNDIGYKPMVVRTQLRIIRLVLNQLDDDRLQSVSELDRAPFLLSVMKIVDILTTKTLDMLTSKEATDCLDEQDIQLAMTAFGQVLQLLQVFNVFEDPIRIGKTKAPCTSGGSTRPSFQSFCRKLHDMQLRTWMVLYSLFKEAVAQNKDLFTTPVEDCFDFLRTLHRNLGFRAICGSLNNIFIRMLKDEFFTMTHVDGYDSEQAQVLYDLYGINCFFNPTYELIEHRCAHYPFLDKWDAMQAVDLLLIQSSKLPVKDLVKHNLKDAIDKVHGAASRKRPTESIVKNREVMRAFLRSPIDPMDIFKCLKGQGNTLAVSYVPEGDATLAAKGWYFLMGHISLTKFRAMKRTGPTPTEDVDIAIAFFSQELEYSTTNWETWFRLAQAYDTKIEESVVWSAEKMNNSMEEVSHLQKAAIHCFTMATALAYRSADLAFETSDKMTELYSEFAMRMYSSTRQPFGMIPFGRDQKEKFLSREDTGMTTGLSFQPLRLYTAWKIAKVLFQRAIVGNPSQWTLHFMLAKCLWKMHSASAEIRRSDQPPTAQEVLDAIFHAIELVPGKKETRDSRREPVLEPHYKLVSIVHKLVMMESLTVAQAQEALSHTHYVRSVESPADREGWLPYILAVLKNLRAADKSNWHHRMISRTAQIIFDDPRQPDELIRAASVKQELTQQMFTKTMVLQVWRPEAERAGRHFVYTARYTRLFVRMLELLKDRTNLDLLARRVRRRQHEIFEHSLVWQEIIGAYLRLLRERATLPEGLETSTFSNISHEEFLARKEPLERWMQSQDEQSDIVLDVLREVQELKKVNQNLMKTGPIDDVIGDAYAYLFSTIGKQQLEMQIKEQQDRVKTPEPAPAPTAESHFSKMHIASILSLDGANDVNATKPEPTPEPEAAPTKRRPGIGRREIRAAAEAACLHKSSTLANSSRNGPTERSRVSAVAKPEQQANPVAADSSALGSDIDDADDESELSELEEAADDDDEDSGNEHDSREPVKPMFPGLATQNGQSGLAREDEDAESNDVANGDTVHQVHSLDGSD